MGIKWDLNNLKKNWFLPICATAFLLRFALWTYESIAGIVLAFVCWLIVAILVPNVLSEVTLDNKIFSFFAFLSAIGVSLGASASYYEAEEYFFAILDLRDRAFEIPLFLQLLTLLLSIFFVYLFISFVWKKIASFFKKTDMFSDISKIEIMVYSGIAILLIALSAVLYLNSEMFYGTEYFGDIVFSADSNGLFSSKVWITVTNHENDIRQLLFAVYALPFCGISYLVTELVSLPKGLAAVIIDIPQIVLFILSNFILFKALNLSSKSRMIVMCLLSTMFTPLLFSVMLEQYIVVYFYVILCVFIWTRKIEASPYVLCGATGTLITSGLFMLMLTGKSVITDLKNWIKKMFQFAGAFFFLCALFCRLDVFLKLSLYVIVLSNFVGNDYGLLVKLQQFSVMIKSFYFAPVLEIGEGAWGQAGIYLSSDFSFAIIGIVVIVLAILGFVLTRKERVSQIALVWMIFSFVVTVVVGWGASENGMILYSLYFGWAHFVLLVQLFKRIKSVVKSQVVCNIIYLIMGMCFLTSSIYAFIQILDFGMKYYPVL